MKIKCLLCGDAILPRTDEFSLDIDTNYKLTGCPEGGNPYIGYCLMIEHRTRNDASQWGGMWETGDGYVICPSASTHAIPTRYSIYIEINEGATCDNVIFNPSLENNFFYFSSFNTFKKIKKF